MDTSFQPYLAFLERVLTPRRLKHSLGVMQVMGELVDIYGLEKEQALLTGLLHDAAKDLTLEAREAIVQAAGIPNQAPWERDYVNYQHGPVGAVYVRQELGLRDPLLLDAIHMHTFCGHGPSFDSPLVWCLRFSDLLEPNRRWDDGAHWIRDGMPRLRTLVFSGQLDEAAFFQSGLLVRFFGEAGHTIHPNMRAAYQRRLAQRSMDESCFNL